MLGFNPVAGQAVAGFESAAASAVAYVLVCDAGSYAYTGQPASLVVGRNLALAAGAYDYAGNDAVLTYVPGAGSVAYTLLCDAGSYTCSGSDAVLTYVSGSAATGVAGGAGWPVDWQGKRRKLTLEEQPEKHLRHILDKVVAEYYGEIIESDLPKAVKAEAANVVRPFVARGDSGARVPKSAKVDWAALERNAKAVGELFRIWNERVVDDDEEEFLLLMMH